jgi:hypothetical protein
MLLTDLMGVSAEFAKAIDTVEHEIPNCEVDRCLPAKYALRARGLS